MKKVIVVFLSIFLCISNPVYTLSVNASGVGVVGINVYTFHVGSGACSIVKFTINNGTKQYILVDAGCGYNRAKPDEEYLQTVNRINNFIKNEKITRFKYIIFSHFDTDHIKMLEEIMAENKFTVGQFVYKKYDETITSRLKNADGLKAENSGKLTGEKLCRIHQNIEELERVISKFEKRISNKTVLSPYLDSGNDITIGNDVSDGAGGYKAVRVTIKFLNKNKSYFTDFTTKTNRFAYDYRLAGNNDSLVFIISYQDPRKEYHNKDEYNKKILFCGDIQSNAMNGLLNRFSMYAAGCDLVLWPHHGKILGVEREENKGYTQYKDLYEKNPSYRLNFTNVIAKGKDTYCFVSSDRASAAGSTMDAASLNRLNTFYTYGSEYLMATFDIIKNNRVSISRH